MPTSNPFSITLYSKSFARVGFLNSPVEVRATPRHNVVGTTDLVVSARDPRVQLMTTPGCRAVILFEGEHLMSGYIRSWSAKGPTRGGLFTFTVQDDLEIVARMLGWAVPSASSPFGTQTTATKVYTGAAETVAKSMIGDQLAHNAVDPITVAATHGWGSSITVETRMGRLDELLLTQLDKAGVGLTARQAVGGTTIVVDAYQPVTYPRVLSEAGGQVVDWQLSHTDPKMTRAIIGGPNTATSREFRQIIDSALEATYGYTVEGFVDAQSVDTYTKQDAAGTQALVDNRATSGFSLTLSKSKNFKYGAGGVHVGDRVTVSIAGQTLTDVLRESPIVYTAADGVKVSPAVGERSDDPDLILGRFLAAVGKAIRDLRTR